MSEFEDKMHENVRAIFTTAWTETKGQVVPKSQDIGLSNVGRSISATVLYADMDGSTEIVDQYDVKFAAELYKAFLLCATRTIRLNGGEVRSFDGDRVMGVFIGDSKNSDAAKTGMQINYLVKKVINPALKNQYTSTNFSLRHTVGIDTSDMDLSRFDAAPLIAFTAVKETYYGTKTNERIPARCGAHRVDQWTYTQAGG